MQLRPLFPLLGSPVRHGSRAGLVLAAAALLGGAVPATADLEIEVHSLRSAKGLVHLCMTSQPKSFPECEGDAKAVRMTVPAQKTFELNIADVAPGRYAIALLHDENGNGKVDKALMIPKEGFGFSRDAKVRMGPPSFEAAAFVVEPGIERQRIKMRYIL